MKKALIEFKDFSFRYKTQNEFTLKDINLTIYEGEKVLLLGPSGCGKSTLSNCINGLIPFSYPGEIKGSCKVAGVETSSASLFSLSGSVGTVLQDSDAQFVGLSVGEDIAYALENDNMPRPQMLPMVQNAANIVGMGDFLEHVPYNLSGGQKQRVALAGIMHGDVQVLLFDEPQDSMVIATPFAEDKTAFYYNQKIVGMRAQGTVKIGGEEYVFDPQDSFGLLDWGRGVWTRDNTWYWGAGHGMVDGHVVGFNIGYGFGDTSAASENMIFVDGIAHKFDKVTFNIPQTPDGKDDFLKPWTFTSSDGRFEMDFVPILDRAACTDLKVIISDQHQVFGKFTGKMILDDGSVIVLQDFLGFAEKVRNKW